MSVEADRRPQAWCWMGFGAFVAEMALCVVLGKGGDSALAAAGAAAMLISPLLFAPPFLLLRRHGRPDPGRPFHETNFLVERGIYRVVRHPQYLGYALLIAGFAARCQHPAATALAVVAAVGMHGQAAAEDRWCRTVFGAEFAAYARRVPMYNLPLGALRLLARRGS